MKLTLFSCAMLLVSMPLLAAPEIGAQAKHYTMVPEQLNRYQASAFPDRIILIPTTQPAHSQTVNWRTNTGLLKPEAEIALAQIGRAHV